MLTEKLYYVAARRRDATKPKLSKAIDNKLFKSYTTACAYARECGYKLSHSCGVFVVPTSLDSDIEYFKECTIVG